MLEVLKRKSTWYCSRRRY